MIRNKSFLSGLGIGIIAATIMLQLVHSAQSIEQRTKEQPAELTKEALEQFARKQGYKLVSAADQADTPAQPDAEKAAAVAKAPEVQPPKEAVPAAAAAAQEALPPAAAAPVAQAEAPVVSLPKKSVTVPPGSTAAGTAALLANAGIITDQQSFLNLIIQQQLNDKIIATTYTFEGTPDVAEVVKRLTTR
ncbi:hypothetical protein [Paenibacillus sp. y28]|uniref:hypothetical protein n=1 Tax=Paenibacillus sp. y28 TaxID=3129110 RepID=UPI0030195016